ncbi:MAG TPA: hypothetical protein PLO78_09380, partial [Candidatus Omnitrophota bacterium]|nr:hypothetical protein [Candidatus Omnitrophota bacterium]
YPKTPMDTAEPSKFSFGDNLLGDKNHRAFDFKNNYGSLVSFVQYMRGIAGRGETVSRAEIRSAVAAPISGAYNIQTIVRAISLETKTFIQYFNFGILPHRLLATFASQGTAFIAQVTAALGLPVLFAAAETDVVPASVVEKIFGENTKLVVNGNKLLAATQLPVTAQSISKLGGSVLIGTDLLQVLARENPRALFYLLKEFHNMNNGIGTKQPILVTVGDSKKLLASARSALMNRNSGLEGLEITERTGLLDALEAGQILRIVQPKAGVSEAAAINQLIKDQQGGMATLHLEQAFANQLEGGVHFAFGEKVNAKDLMVAVALALVIKHAAELIKGVPDARLRAELLKQFVALNLPGVSSQGDNIFLISQIEKLVMQFEASAYIAVMA